MVFTTVINFVRTRGPDEIWRKRRIFKIAAHFIGRRRNCYSIAVRNVHRALAYATKGRKLKKKDMANLWETRVTAGCEQHNISYTNFREGLVRCNILLNRRTLADLACWEPYTFKALTDIAKRKAVDDGLAGVNADTTLDRIITRGSLNKHKSN
ncbi:39S ribosomal protein L20, mitochondrial [Diorhabda carinulata]|uniref:39S ribosomal protein L20, mitochondrial n=1 Tax=Diorhabda sublineata TaxID=1163346 RepID=UPI0024E1735D|nr:39S ribosomal protein L20, mitochondrial [Diorhabda sublineata]XP_057653006.1 39S ribosomal protein L20, mitochondrial [Diorhabda carinulata]